MFMYCFATRNDTQTHNCNTLFSMLEFQSKAQRLLNLSLTFACSGFGERNISTQTHQNPGLRMGGCIENMMPLVYSAQVYQGAFSTVSCLKGGEQEFCMPSTYAKTHMTPQLGGCHFHISLFEFQPARFCAHSVGEGLGHLQTAQCLSYFSEGQGLDSHNPSLSMTMKLMIVLK